MASTSLNFLFHRYGRDFSKWPQDLLVEHNDPHPFEPDADETIPEEIKDILETSKKFHGQMAFSDVLLDLFEFEGLEVQTELPFKYRRGEHAPFREQTLQVGFVAMLEDNIRVVYLDSHFLTHCTPTGYAEKVVGNGLQMTHRHILAILAAGQYQKQLELSAGAKEHSQILVLFSDTKCTQIGWTSFTPSQQTVDALNNTAASFRPQQIAKVGILQLSDTRKEVALLIYGFLSSDVK